MVWFTFLLFLTVDALNVPGWSLVKFPLTATHMPSVTLFGTDGVAAIYQNANKQFSLSLSNDRGKNWDPPTAIAESATFDHAIVASGSDLFMFFVNDTISGYRKLSGSSTVQPLPQPFSRKNVNDLTGTWHSTQLLGYTACGKQCVALLYGVLEDLANGFKRYTLYFSSSQNTGVSWNTSVVESWSEATTYDLITLTAGDLAYADGTFIIGMSSRSAEGDTVHSDLWRESSNYGKSWRSFTGWSGFQREKLPASDIQIVSAGKDYWVAVVTLLSSHKPLLVHGATKDTTWTSGIVPARGVEGFNGNFFFVAQFHQGLIGLYTHGTNVAMQLSLTNGNTWGDYKDITTIDLNSGSWEHNFSRRGSFVLPRGILTVNSSGTVYLLTLDDPCPSTSELKGTTIPYTCCDGACPAPTPTPSVLRPPVVPPTTPQPPVTPGPPPFWSGIGLTGPQIAFGSLGAFLALALVMAIVSIVVRRFRRRGGQSTLIVNDLDSHSGDSSL